MIHDVTDAEFPQKVLERSADVPVVVDFWAEWCGPCRVLTPALEQAATARGDKVDLAKVDVDANPGLAQAFRVQSIPTVKAFRDGEVAAEFTGAIPPPEVERFFDELADNFNTPAARAVLFEWVSEANRRLDAGDRVGRGRLPEMLYALGLEGLLEAGDGGGDPRAEALLAEREQARAARDFDRADALRSELEAMGYEVRDGPAGPRLVPMR